MGNLKSNLDKLKEAMGIVRPSEALAQKVEIALASESINENEPETKEVEEWVWIEGYKGMDKDMRCRDFQYEIGKRYDMPEDAVIEVCVSGFHFCRYLKSTFNYYALDGGNRFFKVRGLVSAEKYYCGDKFVAKSIEILGEVSRKELLEVFGADEWEEKYQDMLFTVGYRSARYAMSCDELVAYGYSLPFAKYLVDAHKFEIAKVVGSQSDLSMDMKVLMIMNSK
jgi:hypothetical protein